jgi:Leucine-rich repeat (LRR) protein
MPAHIQPPSHRWRKLIRFSMRTLIVLVLIFGGGMGWLVRSARTQHKAVSAVTSVGGSVMYDWEWNKRKAYNGRTAWLPTWISDRLGVDYFAHVTSVWLYNCSKDPDTVLVPVALLTQLEWLSLAGASVTDAGLVQLKNMTSLSRVDLDYTKISDGGLVHLKGLTGVSVLSLNGTPVTDAGLAHLKGLTNLKELNLAGTPITDAGLAHLNRLQNLAVLNVVNTQVSDTGMNKLKHAHPNMRIYH